MITLDTSAIYAYLNRTDPHHNRTVAHLSSERPPFFIPIAILSELAYLVESRHGPAAFDAFLNVVERGDYFLDCGERDIPRIRTLAKRYQNFPLGFADAAVIACAERRGGKVLTYDVRHFPAVAREGTIQVIGAD